MRRLQKFTERRESHEIRGYVVHSVCLCGCLLYCHVYQVQGAGAGSFFGSIFSPTIPFIMLFALYVIFTRLYGELIEGLPLKERFVSTFRLMRVMLSSIPIQHTVCIAFVCDVLRENRHASATQNNTLTGRIYTDIANLVMA